MAPSFFQPGALNGTCRHASNRGCPLLRRASGANSEHGPSFATLRPSLSRAVLESNRLPGGSHIGPVGPVSNGKRSSTSLGTYCPTGRRPRSLPAKGKVPRHVPEGTRTLRGVPSGGLLAARQTSPGVLTKDQVSRHFHPAGTHVGAPLHARLGGTSSIHPKGSAHIHPCFQ